MLDSDEEGSRKVPSDVIRNLRRNNNRRNRPRTAFNFSPHSISAKFHLGTIGENDFIRICKFVERLDYQNRIPGSSCGATALSHSIFHAIAKSRANIATTPVIHTHLFPEPDFKTSGILVIIVCDVEIQIEFDFQSVRQFDFPRIGITVDLADKLTGVVHLRYAAGTAEYLRSTADRRHGIPLPCGRYKSPHIPNRSICSPQPHKLRSDP